MTGPQSMCDAFNILSGKITFLLDFFASQQGSDVTVNVIAFIRPFMEVNMTVQGFSNIL